MSAICERFDRLLERLRSEQGIALPMALLIMVVGLGLASVPIVASVNSQNADSRNQAGNEALAAAEAGAELAVLRQSQSLPSNTTPCVSATLAKTATSSEYSGAKWCAAITGNVGEASYSYQVNPCFAETKGTTNCNATCKEPTKEDLIRVVSTGRAKVAAAEPSKRIQMVACSTYEQAAPTTKVVTGPAGSPETITENYSTTVPGTKTVTTTESVPPPNVFARGQIVGIESLNMNNDAQVYNGSVGSNGWVTMSGSANVCGVVNYGTTFTTDNSSSNTKPSGCTSRTAAQGTSEYPGIAVPANIGTVNSDARLAEADPVGSGVYQRGNISWNASNRTLSVNYDQITLEGTSPYWLCKLTLAGGSDLLAGSGKSIKIYFDSPANCPGLNGGAQLQIANGAHVGADANHGPGFYFVGSENANEPSRIELGGGAEVSQFFVYAPKSAIVANNGVNLNGAIIGKTLELAGGADINKSGAYTPPAVTEFLGTSTKTTTKTEPTTVTTTTETIPGAKTQLAFNRRVFVECSAAPATAGTAPNTGC